MLSKLRALWRWLNEPNHTWLALLAALLGLFCLLNLICHIATLLPQ